jgi:phosphoglycerate dehydrogenase-like enzyme
MRVVAHDPYWDAEFARTVGVEQLPLDEVVRAADFLTLHLPASPETDKVMNATRLRSMKPTAFLINTARGTLVDEPALEVALRENWIAGAALDVFDTEPLPADHPLRTAPNTVLTPHLGYVTRGTYQVYFADAVEDIAAFLDGDPLRLL